MTGSKVVFYNVNYQNCIKMDARLLQLRRETSAGLKLWRLARFGIGTL